MPADPYPVSSQNIPVIWQKQHCLFLLQKMRVWIYDPTPLIAIKSTKALENMDDLLYNAKNIQEDTPNSKGV